MTQKIPHQTNKVGLPPPYVFNFALGLDVLYLHDSEGQVYMFLNMVDLGTTFQVVAMLQTGHGTPRSAHCLDTIMARLVSWAGCPKKLGADKGS